MSTLQKAAETAALVATGLASELYELSQVERVHEVRLDNLADRYEKLQNKVEAILNVVKSQAPVAPAKPKPPSTVVYVPVDKFLRTSGKGGSHYAIKGFVGGRMDNGGPRPDDARHFPKEAIVDVSRPGLLGITRTWLVGTFNTDVLAWVQKFPQSITLL